MCFCLCIWVTLAGFGLLVVGSVSGHFIVMSLLMDVVLLIAFWVCCLRCLELLFVCLVTVTLFVCPVIELFCSLVYVFGVLRVELLLCYVCLCGVGLDVDIDT